MRPTLEDAMLAIREEGQKATQVRRSPLVDVSRRDRRPARHWNSTVVAKALGIPVAERAGGDLIASCLSRRGMTQPWHSPSVPGRVVEYGMGLIHPPTLPF
jgi:hypothetical protein